MMRKFKMIMSMIMCGVLVSGLYGGTPTLHAAAKYTLAVGGKYVEMGSSIKKVGSTFRGDGRKLAVALGATAGYKAKKLTLKKGKIKLIYKVNSKTVSKNGKSVKLKAKTVLSKKNVMIDIKKTASLLGYKDWTYNNLTKNINLTKKTAAKIVINEIMAANDKTTGIKDSTGKASDWLELYNPGSSAVNLKGYYLSDKSTELKRWKFPSVTIPAKGVLLVWASGLGTPQNGEMHTNFKISALNPEHLILVKPGGTESDILDKVDKFAYTQNKSWGRSPDGSSNWVEYSSPTPGKLNK